MLTIMPGNQTIDEKRAIVLSLSNPKQSIQLTSTSGKCHT